MCLALALVWHCSLSVFKGHAVMEERKGGREGGRKGGEVVGVS